MSKIAIVTGASGGIGRAAAQELMKKGCKVYDLSRRDIPAQGVTHIACDVTDEAAVRSAVHKVIEENGRVDILVCCAGFGISGAVEFTDPGDSRALMDVNVFGTDRAVRAVLGKMREQHSGRIVITSSVAAVTPIPFQTWYSAAKAALNSYAMALSNEVRPYGIGVSVILPGDIATGFTAARKKSHEGNAEYDGRIDRSVARMEHDEQNGLPPETAGKIIAHAALRKHAKHYKSTGLSYSAICVIAKVLPTRLVQRILYMMYAK